MIGYESELKNVLYQLGVNSRYCGFGYVVYSVEVMLQDPEARDCIKIAYLNVCEKYGVDRVNVERDVRTLISTIWNHGNRDLLEIIAGEALERKPRAKEFLLMLVEYAQKLHATLSVEDICE